MRPLIPPPTIDNSKFSIVYHLGADPNPAQQEAIFYTGFGRIATVQYEGYVVDVFCDGETKANLLDAPQGQVVSTLYFPEDFERAGLDTDDVLRLADEKGFIDWVNNSWFDLYCYGEHLDCVSHELSEAIFFAKTYVGDRWIEAEQFMR